MKSLRTLFRIQFALSVREFSGVLFGILLPSGLMLLLGVLYGDKLVSGTTYTMVQQAFPAVMTIGICATGLMGLPLTISGYREKKVLKRFMVTPTSPMTLLMSNVFNQMVFTFISSGMVWLIAKLVFGYTMIGHFGGFLLSYLIVVMSIYSIGMMVASVSKNINTANLLTSLLYFPMFFLSGATVPYEIMPKGLQAVANVMPLTHGIKLLKEVSLGNNLGDSFTVIMALLIVAIICMIISVKTFRYDYTTN